MPLSRHALQLRRAAVLELEARAGDKILDRLRDEHLSRRGLYGDPRADVHGHAGQLLPDPLAFAGVQPRPDLQAELVQGRPDRVGTADRADGAVERGKETVTGRVDLT